MMTGSRCLSINVNVAKVFKLKKESDAKEKNDRPELNAGQKNHLLQQV
jgi:hypothetical protein